MKVNHRWSRIFRHPLLCCLSLFLIASPSWGESKPAKTGSTYILRYDSLHHPVAGQEGMVASQNHLSSQVGRDTLAMGGNAIDAAVAMGFSLAVTLPRAGNLGGGGFMMVYVASEDKTVAIDYRGAAPLTATAQHFLKADGSVNYQLSKTGYSSSTVPGTVAGLFEAHQRWGKLPWSTLLEGAIKQAEEGIVVSRDLAWAIRAKAKVLRDDRESLLTYFRKDGVPYESGDLMRRVKLAQTLKQIAAKGRDGFYGGTVAQTMAKSMRDSGGYISEKDLASYRARVTEPLRTSYRDVDIATMPPPAGGVHLVQMLNMLEAYPMADFGANSADSLHVLAEVMKRAYAYRAQYLGDPAFVSVPTEWLASKALAQEMISNLSMKRATPVNKIKPQQFAQLQESRDTTHYSVMDKDGNVVSNTYTLSASFGSGVTIPGTGILMNNQINNFALRHGVAGAVGANASFANALVGGKRTKSTQTPVIVFKDGRPYLATGTPGGRRIITTMLQIISNVVDHGMNIADATHAPRIFHGWTKDELEYEPGISADTLRILSLRGHPLKQGASMGSVQSVLWDGEQFLGAADSRRPGASALGL